MKIVSGFEAAREILSRQGPSPDMLQTDEREQSVRQIIEEVRRRGDAAVLDFTEKFDGVRPVSLEIDRQEIMNAYHEVDSGLLSALRIAAERITSYHITQKYGLINENAKEGLGWMINPLARVGVHTPGFSAPLPSSLLMTVVPARVAGVKEVLLATPPGKQGKISPVTLVAADIAGVDRVFCMGGAQALAAMAFGTDTVPVVDKLCGPGNIYVTLAKKLLYGVVGIDGLFGPSEVLIIADNSVNPAHCASDLMAQAEHTLGSAVLVTTSADMAIEIARELDEQLAGIENGAELTKSLDERGVIAVVDEMDEAIALANLYAPEHLLLMVDRASSYTHLIQNAGCVIVGKKATVVLGDYIAGPSHVLPTGGTARFSSPLNVTDFIKITSVINVDDATIEKLGWGARTIARAEGLEAHARAIDERFNTME